MSNRRRSRRLACAVLIFVASSLLDRAAAQEEPPRIFNHITSMGYMNKEEVSSEEEARFIAEHYDIWRGLGHYAEYIKGLNPNIVLSWGLNVRAIAIPNELAVWAAEHPEYDPEEFYLHYKYDTEIDTDYGTLVVPGYDPSCYPDCPNSSATSWEESRVPDRTNEGWMVPNPRSEGLAHFFVDAILARNQWYGDIGSVFWDWAAGFCIHLDNHLENTWEYEGQQSDSWFVHPSIAEFVGMIDRVQAKYEELHPELPRLQLIANGIAGFWMWDRPDGNDYRTAILASDAVDKVWMEMGVVSGERNQPNSSFLHTALHLKYMRDLPVLMQQKKAGIQLRIRDTEPTDRDIIFALGYAYLFNDPERFSVTYLVEGQEGSDDYGAHTAHWGGAAMAYDIGLPIENPAGVRDISGNLGTNVFYEWARGEDPGNAWQEYTIFARQYEEALVLVKVRKEATAVWDETTETTHGLGANFRSLHADGSMGDPATNITLRNNEAAILIRENNPPFLDAPTERVIGEGEELRFNVSGYDADTGDTLYLRAYDLPEYAQFWDNRNRTGTFRWIPGYDQAGTYPGIRFEVTDEDGAVFSRELTITVTDREQSPTDAPSPSAEPGAPGFHAPNPYRAGAAILLRWSGLPPREVAIFDVFGRKIRALRQGSQLSSEGRATAGEMSFVWDGRDDAGIDMTSGVYHLRAQMPTGSLQYKFVLLGR